MSPRPVSTGDGARGVNPRDTKCSVSWWADHAQPEQRASFITAARDRHIERTKLEDTKEGKKNQAMRHVIDPRGFPPSTREKR